MKKIYALLIVVLLLGCNHAKVENYTVISFKITGFEGADNDVFLASSASDISIEKPFRKDYQVDNNEWFVDTLNLEKGIYYLGDGSNYIVLDVENGSNISVTYDVRDYKSTLVFNGDRSERSNYRFQKNLKKDKALSREMYNLGENEYLALHRKLKKDLIDFIRTYEGISEEFKAKEIRNIHFEYLSYLFGYERSHAHYTNNLDFKVSEGFNNEFEDLDYNNEDDFIFSRAYQGLVFNHIRSKSRTSIKENPLQNKDLALLLTINDIPSDIIRNQLFYRVAVPVDLNFTEELEPLYQNLMAAYSKRFKYLQKEEVRNDSKLSQGNPSPEFFNFENLAGGSMSLEDFKGQYVFMDIWATWCAPCKDQIPFLKKAEQIYHDKNIEFVSISVDKSEDYVKLKNLVKELNVGGTQLYANGQWRDLEFMTKYHVNSIPRFILIDPDGKIVDADAPRPSELRFIQLLDGLLK